MASKNQWTSVQLKNSTMLANKKIYNIYPMKKTLYSPSPGPKKNRWYKFETTPTRARGNLPVNTKVEWRHQTALSTGPHRRPMAATYLISSCL